MSTLAASTRPMRGLRIMRAGRASRLLAGLLIAAAMQSIAVAALPDALDRPAAAARLTSHPVVLAVTSAGERLVAAGERGLVLLSDDAGKTWRQAKVPVSVSLTNLRLVDAKLGWCVGHGGVVLGTRDGGETWQRQLDGRQLPDLILQAARSGDAGAGADSARAAADAERLRADGPDKPFLDVLMLDADRGLVVGAFGLVMATRDGGATWSPALDRLHAAAGRHLYALQPVAGAVLVAGEQGAMLVSRDGAQSFAELKTPYAGSYFGVAALTATHFIAYGLRGNAYRTVDAGASWQKLDLGTSNSLTAAHVGADGRVVLVDDAGGVFVSPDGGASFRSLQVPNRFPFTGIAQARDGALVLSGSRGLMRIEPSAIAQRTEQ